MYASLISLLLCLPVNYSDGLPPVSLSDLRNMPSREQVNAAVEFASARIAWCEGQQRLSMAFWHDWDQYINDLKWRRGMWECLRYARDYEDWGEDWAWQLETLRSGIGPADYYGGRMPVLAGSPGLIDCGFIKFNVGSFCDRRSEQ